jgi:Flp pilus assembly CpaF family ATPase
VYWEQKRGGHFQRSSEFELSRTRRMLRTALGPLLLARLEDPGMAEVMLNPDGRVWIDRFDVGLVDAGLMLSSADASGSCFSDLNPNDGARNADEPRPRRMAGQ